MGWRVRGAPGGCSLHITIPIPIICALACVHAEQDTLYKKTDMRVYEQMLYRSTAGFEERFVPAYRSFVAKHPKHRKTLTSWWDDRVYPVSTWYKLY